MVIRSSHLGEIGRPSFGGKGRRINLTVPLTLEQVTEKYKNPDKKELYYIGRDGGTRLFGMEGSSRMLAVCEDIYAALGSPQESEGFRLSEVLRKAGYNP